MIDQPGIKRATVHDVARQAGVSLATVDRVLNGRPGVRPLTVQKVEAAIAALDFRRDVSASLMARSRDLRLRFFIPDGPNEFMVNLGAAVERLRRSALEDRMHVQLIALRALDALALVEHLDLLDAKTCDCAVIVAIEDDRVVEAVNAAARRGIAIITLVSDLPGSSRRHFVGIDNVAAGRTAASLMGRFCRPSGKIGLIAGSLDLRDHRERLDGFQNLIAAEFPGLVLLAPFESHDDAEQARALVTGLLDAHSDLAGLYNLGAGNAGLVAALTASGHGKRISVIAHELTEPTIAALHSGIIDVVLDQNPEGEIRAAIDAARHLAMAPRKTPASGRQNDAANESIEIGVFLRDNLRRERNPT